jgi:hypothetical protein
MPETIRKVVVKSPLEENHEGNFYFPIPQQFQIVEVRVAGEEVPFEYQAQLVVQGFLPYELKGVHKTRDGAKKEALEACLKLFQNAVEGTKELLNAQL